MLAETVFIFSLIAFIASLLNSDRDSIFNRLTGNELGVFLSITFYLAIVPVVLELLYWYLRLNRDSKTKIETTKEESKD